MKQIHFNIKVTGRVQGVGFRAGATHKAKALGIYGYVQNNVNGGVDIEVEGNERKVNEFVQWCHEGPILATVEDVAINSGKIRDYSDFSIRKKKNNLLE